MTLAEARAAYDAAKQRAIVALHDAYEAANEYARTDAVAAEMKYNATRRYDLAMDAAAREFEQATGYAPDSPAIR